MPVTVNMPKRFEQALSLPRICNLNPRSIYNKIEEFKTLVDQYELDVIFLSESWERDNLPLCQILDIPNFEVVSNVYQRREIGGRPAIVANSAKYHVQNLTNTVIQIPWGVEAVWCTLTPIGVKSDSSIQKIACCSLYSKRGSKKKSLLLDHISEAYSLLCTKYGKGLQFIIAGDFNDLKYDQIIDLNPKLIQIVKKPTRLNPPAVLDPIIMTMANYYQEPICIDPLDADDDKIGEASDHRTVICKPINVIENKCTRSSRIIDFRPIHETGITKMKEWLVDYDWKDVYNVDTGHEKAEVFQNTLLTKVNEFFPMKRIKINSDDEPWFNTKLKRLDRRRKRVYRKEKRSQLWKDLDLKFKKELKQVKQNYYRKEVAHLKLQKPGKWFQCLKRISSLNQRQKLEPIVEEINHLPDQKQAQLISDKFAFIPNQFDALKSEDIKLPSFSPSDVPKFHPAQVWFVLSRLETGKSTVTGDIPAKLIKLFAAYLCEPLTHVFNTCIQRGEYPNIFKYEICTPVPKKYPTQTLSQLRNISGLLTFDKIFEKLLSELIISDMEPKLDRSQFGNQKNISIQHYLIQMLQKIHSELDKNSKGESNAVLAGLVDWENAFPRQCPKLGVQSFIDNGVRPSLIPILVNYFQDRHMSVKWHGLLTEFSHIKGGGPAGATLGLLEYLSQSNGNANCVPEGNKFKFVDDLTTLEIINLITVGMTSFNIWSQVPNDIETHNNFIPSENLFTQKWLNEINVWSENQKMVINEKKTKAMLFNFSKTHQFSTRLQLKDRNIEFLKSTKLLGTIVQNNLKWDMNTKELVKRAYARMELLRRVASFGTPPEDLKVIYILFVRSILEQSSVVWHSSLTQENRDDLERVQKSAVRVILRNSYKDYETGLAKLNLETLDDRRENLCLSFARKCTKNKKLSHMFPLREKTHEMKTRKNEKYQVYKANNERYRNSAIIHMQHLLNSNM